MQQTLSLFDEPEDSLRSRLARELSALAAQNILLGGSSWKYEGWLGSVYTRERYAVRGRFSMKQFERDCLREYCEVFPTVCGDFAFYQFPTVAQWQRLFQQAPAHFRFALKVPEAITLPVFADHPRYGLRAGQANPNFLNAQTFDAQFLRPLLPYADRVAVLMFEFPAAIVKAFLNAKDFAGALGRFLAQLPKAFRYGVELRQPAFFEHVYLQALREKRVAHVFNSWTDMPAISEQTRIDAAFTTNFVAVRALVRPGRKYQDSLNRFAPFAEMQEPNEEIRNAIRQLLVRAKLRSEPIFVYVNNRLEGFAPGTISALIQHL